MESQGGRSLALFACGVVCTIAVGLGAGENPPAELAATLSGPTRGSVGSPLVFTATVTNRGPGSAPRAELRVGVTDAFPLQLESESASGGAACVREAAEPGLILQCGPWEIAPGGVETATLTFRVQSDEPTTLRAEVTSGLEPGDFPVAARVELLVNRPIYLIPAELAPPTLLSKVLPAAYLGEAYSARIDVESASPPVRFNPCGRVPTRLAVSPEGIVSGIPVDFGQFRLCITMQDARGNSSVADLVIYTVPRWQLIARPLPFSSAVAGKRFDVPIAMGGRPPYSATINGRLPPGLVFDPATGHLAGTPTQSGPFRFMVWVRDAGGARSLARNALFLYAYPGFPTSAHPELTPGAARDVVRRSTVGKTLSRSAPRSVLRDVLLRYGLPADAVGYSIDQLVPVQLGGAARDPSNLWPAPSPAAQTYSAEAERLRRRVCSGRITLAAARQRIVKVKREPAVQTR